FNYKTTKGTCLATQSDKNKVCGLGCEKVATQPKISKAVGFIGLAIASLAYMAI
ncbi:MAG: hypothetical protein CG439_915, partial [Methylococcaceae bacterium NSP1-2]